jgi:MFS family permease
MIGTAETFAFIFAVRAGVPASSLGWLATLPVFLGALFQWILPQWIPFARLKTAILSCHAIQIAGLMVLAASVYSSHDVFEYLIVGLSLYWIGGMLSGPLWLDWMSPWLPYPRFTKFLSRRNTWVAVSTLGAYLLTATLIHTRLDLHVFLIPFVIAMAARLVSVGIILRQTPPQTKSETHLAPPPQIGEASKPIWMMILVTSLFKFSTNTASPFFISYMLDELHFSLLGYVFMTSIPFVARALFITRWGEASRQLRPYVGLQLTMFGIALNALLWSLSPNYYYLMGVEFLSGLMWGGFDLCAVLIIQNLWPGSARALVGFHLALMSLMSLLGAWVGGEMLKSGMEFTTLFQWSSAFRIVCAALMSFLLARIPETRASLRVYGSYLSTLLTVRPSLGVIGRMVPLRRRHLVRR